MYYLRYVILQVTQEDIGSAWISSLSEAGIQVISDDDAFEASLWITDDAQFAKECVNRGRPVLGVLTELHADQGFDGVSYLVSDLPEVEPQYLEKVYRRQAGIHWDVLETKRCLLRETTLRDADAFYEIYEDPSVTEHLEDLPKDRDAFAAWLEDYTKSVYEFLGYGIWTVCLKREGLGEREDVTEDAGLGERDNATVIGRAGLTVREGFDVPELGFVIGKPWQGQGIAYEICSAILDYARKQGIPEVIAFAESENEASLKLLQKLGFHITGQWETNWQYSISLT